MKLNKLWTVALALLAMTACNNELEPDQALRGTDAPKIIEVPIELTVTTDIEDMRAAYDVEENGAAYRLNMPERDLNVHLAVTRKGGSVVTKTVVFKKIKDVNRAFFHGKLPLPTDGEGTYRISAILLSEVGGDTEFALVNQDDPTKVTITQPEFAFEETNGVVSTNVPYVVGWQNLPPLSTDVNGAAFKSPFSMTFRPQGTLLRFRAHNRLDKELKLKRFLTSTNAFFLDGQYDFKQSENAYPKFTPIHQASQTGGAIEFQNEETIEPDAYSKWYYVWVMPRASSVYSTRIEAENASGSLRMRGLVHHHSLSEGSVRVTVPINQIGANAALADIENVDGDWGTDMTVVGYTPLSLLAEHNINQSGNGFASGDENRNLTGGYFTVEDATRRFSTFEHAGKTYRLGLYSEWVVVMPYVAANVTFSPGPDRLSQIEIYDGLYYFGDYTKSADGKIVYASRFRGSSDKNALLFAKHNRLRSAYRYEIIGNSVENDPDVHILIKARYIGGSETENNRKVLEKIANEDYWNAPDVNYITRTLPLAGYMNVSNQVIKRGLEAVYLSKGLYPGIDPTYAGFEKNSLSYGLLPWTSDDPYRRDDQTKYTVRLFKVQADAVK